MSREITADFIVELFERDAKARRRLAELLVSEPEIRLTIISAALREVALKSDIENLRREIRNELDGLRREISDIRKELSELRGRVSRVEAHVDLLIKVFLGFNVPLLVAVIGILLKMIFG